MSSEADNRQALREDLESKLAELQKLYRVPALYIAEHFDLLRNEIDYTTEENLELVQNAAEDNADRLYWNQMRSCIIDELSKREKECALACKLSAAASKETVLLDLRQRIESAFSDGHKTDEYEDEYNQILIDLDAARNEVKYKLFLGRTVFLLKKEKIVSSFLIVFDEVYFNEYEIECLKKFPQGLEAIFKILEQPSSKKSQMHWSQPRVASSNLVLIHNFTKLIEQRLDGLVDTKMSRIKLSGAVVRFTTESLIQMMSLAHGNNAAGRLALTNGQLSSIGEDTFKYTLNVSQLFMGVNCLGHLRSHYFNNLVNLKELELRQNNITTIDPDTFSCLPGLEGLYLFSNKIEALSSSVLRNLTKLVRLNLDDNQLSVIEAGTFSSLSSLRDLLIARNQIAEIHKDAFKGLVSLVILDLRGNQIKSIDRSLFSSCQKLLHISLVENPFEKLDPEVFESQSFLKTLSITNLDLGPFKIYFNSKGMKTNVKS